MKPPNTLGDLRAQLIELRTRLEDAVDGGEECKGHDSWISGQISYVNRIINTVEELITAYLMT